MSSPTGEPVIMLFQALQLGLAATSTFSQRLAGGQLLGNFVYCNVWLKAILVPAEAEHPLSLRGTLKRQTHEVFRQRFLAAATLRAPALKRNQTQPIKS